MVKKSFVSAPGKIILSGEHSVVYDKLAILAAINRRLFVEIEKSKNGVEIVSNEPVGLAEYALQKTSELLGEKIDNLRIKIKSEIPVNRGMGSSAALSVAIVGGLFKWFDKEWDKNLINQIAHKIEKKQHQNPSGGDNSISCFGGIIIFQKGKIDRLKLNNLPDFVLLDSGKAVEPTGEMVELVATKKLRNRKTEKLLDSMGKVTLRLIEVLKKDQFDYFEQGEKQGSDRRSGSYLKWLIAENERLLEKLEVVGNKAKRIIRKIENIGGVAKICGAGGMKEGSGILLCYHQDPDILLNFAKRNKIPSYRLKLGEEGLRNEG